MKRKGKEERERERTTDMGGYDETNELVEAVLLHINDYTLLCGKGEAIISSRQRYDVKRRKRNINAPMVVLSIYTRISLNVGFKHPPEHSLHPIPECCSSRNSKEPRLLPAESRSSS